MKNAIKGQDGVKSVNYNLNGNGYVVSQNVSVGTIVGSDMTVELTLSNGY